MDPAPRAMNRRSFLLGSLGMPLVRAHAAAPPVANHGRVQPPLPVPDVAVFTHAGRATRLGDVARGKPTALHLMFTQCASTCPIQAAIFQRVQWSLGNDSPDAQLLSVSIDPRHDSPPALAAWLRQVGASEHWLALQPRVADLDQLRSAFGARSGPADTHSTQVSIIDRQARVVWRSIELPSPEEIVAVLRQV